MRRILAAAGGTVFASFVLATAVAASGPTPAASPNASAGTGPLPAVLGLTQADIHDMRQDGMSLAQIAAQQAVDVQKVIDALVARWTERIDARVANGALTPDQAAALKAQLQTKATEAVNKTTPGGMQGAAVGAGPRNGAGNGVGNGAQTRARDGSGAGTGTCDGTGPHGPGRP